MITASARLRHVSVELYSKTTIFSVTKNCIVICRKRNYSPNYNLQLETRENVSWFLEFIPGIKIAVNFTQKMKRYFIVFITEL
jgi:hypothetical protein